MKQTHLPRTSFWFVLGLLVLLLQTAPAQAQRIEQIEERLSNVTSYFYHAQPGATTIQVYALGTLRSPGLYEVPAGTNLGELIALSGGPVQNVRQSSHERQVHLRLIRTTNSGSETVYEVLLEDGKMPDPTQYPTLETGDVLQVEVVEREQFTWRDGLQIVNAAAVITLAIVRFTTGR